MRIVGGKYKGGVLNTLDSLDTRPMINRIKEDLFNILNNYFYFENKIGLDIFSGSGQLGIEGVSRGLKLCYLNDASDKECDIIAKNVQKFKINNIILLNLDYNVLLSKLKDDKVKIDILFLDPPFRSINYYYDVVEKLIKYEILNNYGIIACESNQEIDFSKYESIVLLKFKKYKNKFLYVWRKEEGDFEYD